MAATRFTHTVTVSTELDAPAEVIWRAVQTPELFVHVAHGLLRYPSAEHARSPMRAGDQIRGWTFLFRVVPFSVHSLRVAMIDAANRRLDTEEAGGLVRTWNHRITVEALPGARSRYEDRIEIGAGLLTPVVAAFAHVFYRYRQRRWRTLAPVLAAFARGGSVTPGV